VPPAPGLSIDDGGTKGRRLRERIVKGEYPNVLVDDAYRESVCFLCVDKSDDTGAVRKEPCATAFVIGMPLKEIPKGFSSMYRPTDASHTLYLVTARHVLDESRSSGTLFARMNLRSGGVTHCELPQDSWTSHTSSDVAIVPIILPPDARIWYIVPLNFADDVYLEHYRPEPGDEIFFLGLFSKYFGTDEQAEPIVRFGHISLGLKNLTIQPNSVSFPIKTDAYLAETKSWGGESGSPVFHSKWQTSPTVPVSTKNPRLIGLLHGHYNIPKNISDKSTVDLNSGIGVIIPFKYIWQLLNLDAFVKHRERLKKELDSKTPTPTRD
jgi:hypothetical protein